MPTVVLNAYSKDYPAISNRIRASVYLQTNPQALIATIIDSTSGHPARTWSFPGLPRANYGFSLDEINGSDVVVNNLALFDVVPGEIEGQLSRADEQIQVDLTYGFLAGSNSFVFDGTPGAPGGAGGLYQPKPNYIGWEIVPSELDGRGILKKGIDYSWDSTTGTFTLLQSGDVFSAGNVYNIHFENQISGAGGSTPTAVSTDFQIEFIDSNETLDVSYFGKKLIIQPVGDYIEVTLPDISTVPQGRKMMVEVEADDLCCVKFISFGSNEIKYRTGNLYVLPNEHFSIYSDGTNWRVCESNIEKNVGALVSHEFTSLLNAQPLNGSIGETDKHARIYNEVVLELPTIQRCNYDDWNTGNNKYLYSLANSADPANDGKFHFPDRRGLFERNNNNGKAGDYGSEGIGPHSHPIKYILEGNDGAPTGAGQVLKKFDGDGVGSGQGGSGVNNYAISNNTGSETVPVHYLINKYILL